jgi:hypothetical protein
MGWPFTITRSRRHDAFDSDPGGQARAQSVELRRSLDEELESRKRSFERGEVDSPPGSAAAHGPFDLAALELLAVVGISRRVAQPVQDVQRELGDRPRAAEARVEHRGAAAHVEAELGPARRAASVHVLCVVVEDADRARY